MDSRQPWLFTNGVFLNEPIRSTADLKALATAALDHFRPSGHAWFLCASEEWLGPEADAVLAGLGLIRAMTNTGMVAVRLLPPLRPTTLRSNGAIGRSAMSDSGRSLWSGMWPTSRATGLERTVLHASPAGLGLYRRMGYRPVASCPIWEPAPA